MSLLTLNFLAQPGRGQYPIRLIRAQYVGVLAAEDPVQAFCCDAGSSNSQIFARTATMYGLILAANYQCLLSVTSDPASENRIYFGVGFEQSRATDLIEGTLWVCR